MVARIKREQRPVVKRQTPYDKEYFTDGEYRCKTCDYHNANRKRLCKHLFKNPSHKTHTLFSYDPYKIGKRYCCFACKGTYSAKGSLARHFTQYPGHRQYTTPVEEDDDDEEEDDDER